MTNWIIMTALTAAYIALCGCCYGQSSRRARNKKKYVCLPKVMFWVGVVCAGVFLVIGWIATAQGAGVGLTVFFGGFVLLAMLLMLGWKNCFICYDKEGFTQSNLLGMQRSFTYDQVSAWCDNKTNPMEASMYVDGKKISFNLMSENGADFLTKVSAAYRKSHGNKNLPQLSGLKKERGGFRAHVYNPGEYLFIFIMLLVLVLGVGIWMVVDGLMPIDEQDGQRYELTFSSWQIREDELVLLSEQMQEPFMIGGYEKYLSASAVLKENCNGKEVFEVWARRITPDDGDPYFRVYALSSEEAVYRTFENSTAYHREGLPASIGFYSIFLIILLGFSALIYAVGSNPQKFPKWLVYCCFKKDAIDI